MNIFTKLFGSDQRPDQAAIDKKLTDLAADNDRLTGELTDLRQHKDDLVKISDQRQSRIEVLMQEKADLDKKLTAASAEKIESDKKIVDLTASQSDFDARVKKAAAAEAIQIAAAQGVPPKDLPPVDPGSSGAGKDAGTSGKSGHALVRAAAEEKFKGLYPSSN